MQSRTLQIVAVLGALLAAGLLLSFGQTVLFVHDALAALGGTQAHAVRGERSTSVGAAPAAVPAPAPVRVAVDTELARNAIDAGTPALANDDYLPGESEGQRALRVATERNPELGELVDDPDPQVSAAMRAFFEDEPRPR